MRKIIFCLLCGAVAFGLASCMQDDNFAAPAASIHGNIIDVTTGQPLLTDNGDVHVRIWEMSYSAAPTPQDLNVKIDGSYENTKLFAGTYNMLPYDGSWWPCDTTYDVPIGDNNNVAVDFQVMPYLKIKDFTCTLVESTDTAAMDTIVMSGRLFAPKTQGMPQVVSVRPFLSINHFCGGANHIDYYYSNDFLYNLRTAWANLGDMDTGEGKTVYTFKCPVKRGYHYWCRMGANVNDTFQKYNYSDIIDIDVPQ